MLPRWLKQTEMWEEAHEGWMGPSSAVLTWYYPYSDVSEHGHSTSGRGRSRWRSSYAHRRQEPLCRSVGRTFLYLFLKPREPNIGWSAWQAILPSHSSFTSQVSCSKLQVMLASYGHLWSIFWRPSLLTHLWLSPSSICLKWKKYAAFIVLTSNLCHVCSSHY